MTDERKLTLEVSSTEEALNEASRQWKIPPEELKAEVISTEREGFLGLFGARKLRVEVTASVRPDITARGSDFVDEVLRLMGIEAHSEPSDNDHNMLDIKGDDAADYVVGRYGDALKAMEYIVNLALRDPKNEPRLRIDSCGYRERRTKSLERLAEATARQALKYGRPIRLDPMASWERWVIHSTLKERTDVTTESVGESPSRKVVIIPKFSPDEVRVPGPATLRVRSQRERTGGSPSKGPMSSKYTHRHSGRNRRNG